jgi:hypothetical protein
MAATGEAGIDLEAAMAVLGHKLINSLAVIKGGAVLLRQHGGQLPAQEHTAWLERIEHHTAYLGQVFERLTQGHLAGALAATTVDPVP